MFASEPKAIFEDPEVPREADVEAIHHYLTYGYVPSPWSAFRGVRKLPPAHYLVARDGRLTVTRYWSLRYQPKRTEPEAALGEELVARLEEAVRLRLIADVPVGALLSGGIDSSVVVALMRRVASGPVRTFSIGFDQPDYDESRYARLVAKRFETEHHELVVKPDAAATIPRLVWHYNEPFADSSGLPSLAVCEMARGFVTVALNGDGADESFFGYERYRAALLAGWLDRVPPLRWGVRAASRLLPAGRPRSLVYRARRLAEELTLPPERRYAAWMTSFGNPQKTELYTLDFARQVGTGDSLALLDAAYAVSDGASFLERTVHTDVQMYLPDDLLVKMDIASMANSLEVRSPFLDHEVVEFAATLPPALKLRRLTHKYLVRRVMRGLLPEAVLRRKKMGFAVPIDHWFRHELREMAYDTLLDARARARGYFRPEVVQRYLDEHVQGQGHHHAASGRSSCSSSGTACSSTVQERDRPEHGGAGSRRAPALFGVAGAPSRPPPRRARIEVDMVRRLPAPWWGCAPATGVSDAWRRSLKQMEPAIGRARLQELLMGADRLDAPAVQHDDPVGVDDGRQAVRDDDDRHLAPDPLDRLLDLALGLAVERARGLVEHQDRRPSVDGARDRDPLPLPA